MSGKQCQYALAKRRSEFGRSPRKSDRREKLPCKVRLRYFPPPPDSRNRPPIRAPSFGNAESNWRSSLAVCLFSYYFPPGLKNRRAGTERGKRKRVERKQVAPAKGTDSHCAALCDTLFAESLSPASTSQPRPVTGTIRDKERGR